MRRTKRPDVNQLAASIVEQATGTKAKPAKRRASKRKRKAKKKSGLREIVVDGKKMRFAAN